MLKSALNASVKWNLTQSFGFVCIFYNNNTVDYLVIYICFGSDVLGWLGISGD